MDMDVDADKGGGKGGTSNAIPLTPETAEMAAARGMRENAVFEYRGVSIPYSELPDAESNLLFGNVLWPAAETLSRLVIDAARGGVKLWTTAAAMQLGVPLEMLLAKRFGLASIPTSPSPEAIARLGLGRSLVPDVSDMSVLEVGAGVGLAGLACHACGARVLITDGEERLVDALSMKHADIVAQGERVRFRVLDWSEEVKDDCERFDLILGCEVLNPACEGEVHVPRLIGKRLRQRSSSSASAPLPPCALLLSEVRRTETCLRAVQELTASGLDVAAFQVCNGRELFEVPIDVLPPVGAMLLLVATRPQPPQPPPRSDAARAP